MRSHPPAQRSAPGRGTDHRGRYTAARLPAPWPAPPAARLLELLHGSKRPPPRLPLLRPRRRTTS